MTDASALAADLDLARRIADAADAVTHGRFRASDLRVDRKPDRTPVTDADVACEDEVRRLLAAERPDDAVLGEERGGDTTARRHWIVDPIDGTKNYSRGVPVFATLLALVADGEPVVGVVSAPALGRRWWAARGLGAFTSDVARGIDAAPIGVSAVAELGDAYVSTTDLDYWREIGSQDRWLALTRATWESRAFGDFFHHVLVAEGLLDAAVEPGASAWDLAAPAVVVREAGGRLTDFAGTERIDGGDALSTNGRLHDAVLGLVGR
ncbi:inositol monophosphatase family protein [Actinomycetospora sp. TBRC 11914]|uniref:inositol monophosphatase family protein n=1 Tax=Actinomycetospora sp. TBRC 11914 TaxID=2729387 RepID=UPI00145CBFD8|nr:inositol monophosphatase family protein [Actinomycetospora sp. TBRC 11914]NMO90809.1 histidinol-phosphatase [Actinomycetospora sp. TBRC 11914]